MKITRREKFYYVKKAVTILFTKIPSAVTVMFEMQWQNGYKC